MSKKKKKICILIGGMIALLLLVISLIFVIRSLIKPAPVKKAKEPAKIVDQLKDYGYTLNDNATSYYKSLFQELKKNLESESKDEEAYAKLVAQLFITDFFTLENKVSKNDIGGMQYIYDTACDTVEKMAREGIYHYVENNIYGDRKQELPSVTEVRIDDIEKVNYQYLETEQDENAYKITFEITYQKDLGYQTSGILYLVHHGDKLEIAKLTK